MGQVRRMASMPQINLIQSIQSGMRPRFVLLLLLLLVLLPGCRSSLARAVVKTPNHHLSFVEKLDPPAPPSNS